MTSENPGPRAMREQAREWDRQRKSRAKRAAAQKAAKDARAYDDYPGTPADLINDHRAMRVQFYARQSERKAA